MASPEVVKYIKDQLKAGYSPEEIRAALLTQGWAEGEVNEGFATTGKPLKARAHHEVTPPVKIKAKTHHRKGGFLISLVGALLIFIFGLESLLALPLLSGPLTSMGLVIDLTGFIELFLIDQLFVSLVLIVAGILMIFGSFLLHREGKEVIGGILVMVFALVSLVGFNGFLVFVGGILGVIGGILGLKER